MPAPTGPALTRPVRRFGWRSLAGLLFAVLVCHGPRALAQASGPEDIAAWTAMPVSLLPMRLPVPDVPTWAVQGTAADFEAADVTPPRAFSGDWRRYTPRANQNATLQSARIELGASRQRWELAAVIRSDIMITGPRSTFDLVHAIKQNQAPAGGTAFTLDAHDAGAVWTGVRGAHTWVLRPGTDQGLMLTGAVTLLSVQRVQRADAAGRLSYSAITGYTVSAQARRQDSHQQFGGYGQKDVTGTGATADLGLLWQPDVRNFVNLSAVDLLSRLSVAGVSTQQIVAASPNGSLSANGFLEYQPLLSGRNGAANVDTKLDAKWSISAGTAIGVTALPAWVGVRWEHIDSVDMPALWAALPLSADLRLQLDVEFRFHSIGVGLVSRFGALMLRTQSLPVGQSRAIGWEAAFVLPL